MVLILLATITALPLVMHIRKTELARWLAQWHGKAMCIEIWRDVLCGYDLPR